MFFGTPSTCHVNSTALSSCNQNPSPLAVATITSTKAEANIWNFVLNVLIDEGVVKYHDFRIPLSLLPDVEDLCYSKRGSFCWARWLKFEIQRFSASVYKDRDKKKNGFVIIAQLRYIYLGSIVLQWSPRHLFVHLTNSGWTIYSGSPQSVSFTLFLSQQPPREMYLIIFNILIFLTESLVNIFRK